MNKQDTPSILTVLALKSGDKDAFKVIYDHFSGRLYGNLLRLVKSEEIARDLLQDLFLKVWEKREHIDPDKSFSSYLFQISENLAYDFFRKAATNKKLREHLSALATEFYSHVEENLVNDEYNDLLQQAINALPPRRREIFRLCKLEKKSYEEVSVQLGLSTSTISDHIVKATRFIRKYFETHRESLVIVFLCLLLSGL